MGRGRAKAKQTKVARRLKYASGDLDVDALSAELGAGHPDDVDDSFESDDEDDADDDEDLDRY